MIEEFLSAYPEEKAGRLREMLVTGSPRIVSTNPDTQRKVNAIYEVLAKQRMPSVVDGKPTVPARSTANSWQPSKEETLLIRALLNRVPPERRERVRELLLRNDVEMGFYDDIESQKLVDQIYRLRSDRSEAERLEHIKRSTTPDG